MLGLILAEDVSRGDAGPQKLRIQSVYEHHWHGRQSEGNADKAFSTTPLKLSQAEITP